MSISRTKQFFVSLILATFGAHSSVAQNDLQMLTARVQIESKSPVSQVVGLVISNGTAAPIHETRVTKTAPNTYEVIFSIHKSQVDESSVATAYGVGEDQKPVFGTMTPTLLSDPSGSRFSIPECPAEEVSPLVSQSQMAPLKSLVDIRTARSDIAKMKISGQLSGQLLIKLRKFEEAFGLAASEELSADLPPEELVDRLTRLTFALKQFWAAKLESETSK